jgi:hypothetical protein
VDHIRSPDVTGYGDGAFVCSGGDSLLLLIPDDGATQRMMRKGHLLGMDSTRSPARARWATDPVRWCLEVEEEGARLLVEESHSPCSISGSLKCKAGLQSGMSGGVVVLAEVTLPASSLARAQRAQCVVGCS